MLGICAPYKQAEPTYVACRLAEWAARKCIPFTYFTSPPPRPSVDSRLDKYLLDASKDNFGAWLEKCTALVWSGFPPYAQLEYVTRHVGKRTFLFIDPHTIEEEDHATISLVEKALVPTRRLYRLLEKRWKLTNAVWCPYDPVIIPQSRVGLRSKLVRLALPLIDEFAEYSELSFIYQINGLLKQCSNLCIRILISPTKISSYAKRRMRALQRMSGDRLEICKVAPYDKRVKQLLDVDLVVWPALQGGVGCYLTLCASLGIPTICFNIPPHDEIIGETGGYLINVPYNSDDKLRWTAQSDYTEMLNRIVELVKNPKELRLRSKIIQQSVTHRPVKFDTVMDSIFEF